MNKNIFKLFHFSRESIKFKSFHFLSCIKLQSGWNENYLLFHTASVRFVSTVQDHALIVSNYVQGFIQKVLGNRTNLPFIPLVEVSSILTQHFSSSVRIGCSPWDSDGLRPRILVVRRLYVDNLRSKEDIR